MVSGFPIVSDFPFSAERSRSSGTRNCFRTATAAAAAETRNLYYFRGQYRTESMSTTNIKWRPRFSSQFSHAEIVVVVVVIKSGPNLSTTI